MSLKNNLKKVLGVSLCAAMLSVAAVSALAEDAPAPFNLMPKSADAVKSEGGTATLEGGVLNLKAGAAETAFTYEVNESFNVNELYNLYFTLEHVNGFDIKLATNGKTADVEPGVSADFGNDPDFGEKTDKKDDPNVLGTLITTGPSFADKEVGWKGAYTWNNNIPDDGLITVKTVTIRVGANGSVKLSALYMGVAAGAPASDATNTTASAGGGDTTTTAAKGTTTAKKDNPKTGESTAMVAGGVVLALAAAGVVVLTTKKAK